MGRQQRKQEQRKGHLGRIRRKSRGGNRGERLHQPPPTSPRTSGLGDLGDPPQRGGRTPVVGTAIYRTLVRHIPAARPKEHQRRSQGKARGPLRLHIINYLTPLKMRRKGMNILRDYFSNKSVILGWSGGLRFFLLPAWKASWACWHQLL